MHTNVEIISSTMAQQSFSPVIGNGVSVDSAKLAVSYYLSAKLRVNLVKHPLVGCLGWQNGLNYLVKLPSFFTLSRSRICMLVYLPSAPSPIPHHSEERVPSSAFVTCNDACGSLSSPRDQAREEFNLLEFLLSNFFTMLSSSFEWKDCLQTFQRFRKRVSENGRKGVKSGKVD